MTKEDAIRMLKAKLECKTRDESGAYEDCNFCYCEDCHLNDEMGTMDEQMECLQMSIEALEQQPCEDCISREEAINKIEEWANGFEEGGYFSGKSVADAIRACGGIIAELPPVRPKYTDAEIDRAQAVEQAYVDKMVELVAEEAKRPKGKWIKYQEPWGGMQGWKCSNCKNHYDVSSVYTIIPYNYCPNCGAKMLQEDS